MSKVMSRRNSNNSNSSNSSSFADINIFILSSDEDNDFDRRNGQHAQLSGTNSNNELIDSDGCSTVSFK